ncbi:MAG: VCBS repeat-containing protein [Pirellulales bacterium]
MCLRMILSLGLAVSMICGPVAICCAQTPSERPVSGYLGGPYKVVAADFTGDRIVDLALGYHNSDAITLEAGDGRGHFSRLGLYAIPFDERTTIETVHNVDYGDVDGDGLSDLALAVGGGLPESMTGRAVLARNLGAGQFDKVLEYPTESQSKGARLVDLDRDGRLDWLYTARGSGYKGDTTIGKLTIRQGLGGFKFGPARDYAAGPSAYYVETGDLDNDGWQDILVPNEHANTVTYFMNPGKEIFAGPGKLSPRVVRIGKLLPQERTANVNDVRTGDLNGDGNLDLVTANLGPSTISVFLGKGDGSFQKDHLLDGGKNGAFLAAGDLDADGDLDFIVTHWTEDFISVFLNRGDATFSPRTDYKVAPGPYGVTLCDADRDGNLDAATANYRDRSLSVLMGAGDGTFRPAVTLSKVLRLEEGKWVAE